MRDEKEQISIFDALAKREGISPDEEEYVRFVVEKLEAEGLGHLLRWYPNL